MNRCFWKRGAASAVAAWGLALGIHGCGSVQQTPQTPEQIAGEPRPSVDHCQLAAEVQLLLVDLVSTGALGYGSVSPFLYELDARGAVRLVATVETDPSAARRARDLLGLINHHESAREVLAGNVKRSQQECATAGCSRDVRRRLREIRRVLDPKELIETVEYALGAPLGAAEQSAFLLLMRDETPGCPAAVLASFEDGHLILRMIRARLADDCHGESPDGHLDPSTACRTKTVRSGSWQLDASDPRDRRHCCIGQ